MSSFSALAATLEGVRRARGKNEKVRVLAEYLRGLDEREAEHAARFATGRPSTKGSAEETQVGYSTIIEVLLDLTGTSRRALSSAYLKHGDLGEVAEELTGSRRETSLLGGELGVMDVAESFERITRSRGKGSSALKKGHLKSLLLRAGPLEAKYIVKVLTKEMRIGLVDGLVEEAVAQAYSLEREKAREAHLLIGDVGLLAREARGGRAHAIRLELMRPTNFMLAEPMEDAGEVAGSFRGGAYGEYKYDGVRAQLHKRGGEVRVFSRRLEDITSSFPELAGEARALGHDLILDGEIVPFREGRPLPFQLLQRRLRRMEGSEELMREVPVRYFCFDVLLLDGDETYRRELRERRGILEGALRGSGFPLAEMRSVASAEEVDALFRESRSLGYEGLVVKDPASPYTPGRRGRYWVKLKEELDTLDVVVVRAEYGHGKRAGKISDYTFAVRDGEALKVIGKAYSGLTDREIEETMARIEALTVADHGYSRDVRPEIVLEVAFDSVQRSGRHDSGFALRFPRIKRIRDDKGVGEIDTLARVREVYEGQRVKA